MIHVRKAILESYDGDRKEVAINSLFKEPLWKIKEIILDNTIRLTKRDDPFVKVIKLEYAEYGKEN